MVNLKRIIDLTKKIQKNQKNENQVERNKTSQIELNYEIKNKLKIHKKTNNKLKIKRIRTSENSYKSNDNSEILPEQCKF
jgi:hypothetical protein